jgi:hypothetical protein
LKNENDNEGKTKLNSFFLIVSKVYSNWPKNAGDFLYQTLGFRSYFYIIWQKLRLFICACNLSQKEFDWGNKKMKKKYITFWLPYEVQTQIISFFLDRFKYFESFITKKYSG